MPYEGTGRRRLDVRVRGPVASSVLGVEEPEGW